MKPRRFEMPGRQRYWIAAALVVAGFVTSGVFLNARLGKIAEGMSQLVIPGTAELMLEVPGTYTIYHEARSVVDGRHYATPDNVSSVTVDVLSLGTGQPIEVGAPASHTSYSVGGRSGESILACEIRAPVSYRIVAFHEGGDPDAPVVLAIGQGATARLMSTILGAVGFVLLGITLAVVAGFRVVGALLVLGMLMAPPAAAALLTRRLPAMMAASAAIAALSAPIGLLISWHLDVAAGASIVLVPVTAFIVLLAVRPVPR
jgi:hypothetical protein